MKARLQLETLRKINPIQLLFEIIFQTDFNYSSPFWTNKKTFAVDDGLEGLTEKQTKLASYWNTPFDKICLGMKVNEEINWISLTYTASSLHHLINPGYFKSAHTNRNKWLSLINGSRLQNNCNQGGFSMEMKNRHRSYSHLNVRLGFVATDQNHCYSCNSCIGFGITASCGGSYPQTNTTCGNVAICGELNNLNIDTFGYILVQ